ncbi:serine hydroxymethyltransferase [Apilactobacillus apisilvae]|uniref:Serine hydroxymethyltransferase n=1 Tax=Apilactobacillus apisilvae TaxID=2923364 RepID=A0ABY4PH30_9LACO|nr:serine hydroxymethyltransferase [Apilactobacillus apisilvae]UQS85121.1 serine hydroxymethyltransferase [Apilactobacillus apisilvae]
MTSYHNDTKIWEAINEEKQRQENVIELIASENIVSQEIMDAQGSILTNKYAVGYPNKRVYTGNEAINKIDNLAMKRAKELFKAEYANVYPHSGTQANQAAYAALLKPGDKILSMSEKAGGHFTHGQPTNFSGQLYDCYFYGVDPKTEFLDFNKINEIAKKVKPKLIVAGASAYSHIIDWTKFKKIADSVGAYLMIDMAHIAGLVAAGLHPNPMEVADIVTSTTHKTLRGPRGGLILAKKKFANKLDNAVFPLSQSGTLEHVVAAKAIAFKEAMQPEFKEYIKKVILNAQAMAKVFNKSKTIRVVSKTTENHEMTLDITKTGLTGNEGAELLYSVGIATNKELLPNEKGSVMEGIRIGTPTITSRNFNEYDSAEVAETIQQVLEEQDINTINKARQKVQKLTKKYKF